MKLAFVLGTRPEIIKLSPLLRACGRDGIEHTVIHTGQHYSYELDRVFFDQLEIPSPQHNLDVGSGPHGEQTAKMLVGIERVLLAESPTHVIVQGDTNSVVAGALAAAKLGIPIAHVEAGLRSFDRTMPEETNRIVADHVSDLLFAPTEMSAARLRFEGIAPERIHVTGNTIVDALVEGRPIAERRGRAPAEFGLSDRKFALLTAHRAENVDDLSRFQGILRGANDVARELGIPVLYPIHPRSRKMLGHFALDPGEIRLCDPLDFLTFLRLEANAALILTDSGGVQEEACILGVPCVTLRDNTERPETIDVGANRLAGCQSDRILQAARGALEAPRGWRGPFGAGDSALRILDILRRSD